MHWGVRGLRQGRRHQRDSRRIIAQRVPDTKLEIIYLGVEPLELTPDELAAVRARFAEEHGLRFGQDRILLLSAARSPARAWSNFWKRECPARRGYSPPDLRVLGSATARLQALRCEQSLEDRVVCSGQSPTMCWPCCAPVAIFS